MRVFEYIADCNFETGKPMETTLTIKSKLGDHLAAILEDAGTSSSGNLVILTHGYGSGKNNKTNRLLCPRLADYGIPTLRFDFSGHYDSSGDAGKITIGGASAELNDIVDFASQELGYSQSRMHFFGSSFGGSAILWDGSRFNSATRIGLKAPIIDYPKVRLMQLGPDGISRWEETGFAEIDSSIGPIRSQFEFYKNALSNDLFHQFDGFKGKVLIVHGDADDNAPIEDSKRLVSQLGENAELSIVAGAGHGFKGEGQLDRVIDEMVKFFSM